MLELNKASGLWDTRAFGRRIGRAFLDRLVSGPNPLGVPAGRSWASWCLGLGPRYPQCLPFSYRGGRLSPVGKKNKFDRHIMGNSLPLMLLNFQCKFYNFFVTVLDVIGSSGSILRYKSSYKKARLTRFVILLVIHVPPAGKDNRSLVDTLK